MTRVNELYVNDARRAIDAPPDTSLLEILRDHLGLTGAKYGCGEGQCGACMVLVDGQPIPSCITPLGAAAGKAIVTVEGLERHGRLHPVQQAFVDVAALQCGYCTPGMIISAVALLQQNPAPTEGEIIAAMQPHVCRCGAYSRIVRAIQHAGELLGERRG